MEKAVVFDIMRFSTQDGPGIRTTVFLKGCPLGCLWCHNPESQSIQAELMFRPNLCIRCLACIPACPQGAIAVIAGQVETDRTRCTLCAACVEACLSEARATAGREMTVGEVMAEVVKDVPFYDESGGGVTFSGGEPLLQRDFLLAALLACRREGIHTAVDTSGFAAWPVLDGLRESVDLFLYDLKTVDDGIHRAATGVSNELILANLRRLSELGHKLIVRMPLIPGISDRPKSIRETAEFLVCLPQLLSVDLLPYHLAGVEKYRRLNRPYAIPDLQPPTEAEVERAVQIFRESGLPIHVGG